jgi:hypothetical protein
MVPVTIADMLFAGLDARYISQQFDATAASVVEAYQHLAVALPEEAPVFFRGGHETDGTIGLSTCRQTGGGKVLPAVVSSPHATLTF